jgi:hypothetical protein
MAKQRFNDPDELYLLDKWMEVRQLEKAMQKVREKYTEIFVEVLDRVSTKHKELNRRVLNCGEMPTDEDGGYINVGIGRKAWPSESPRKWPTGFWVGGVSLEDLKSEAGDLPYASVWIFPPENSTLDLETVAKTLESQLREIITNVEIYRDVDHSEGSVSIDCQLPESRNELLDLLLKNESRGFIECMVGHFESLTKLINTIDGLFENGGSVLQE